MRRVSGIGRAIIALFLIGATASARAPHRVNPSYDDTVRIGILSNSLAVGSGNCLNRPPVGPQTLDFVIAALDTSVVKNVKISNAPYATVDTILAMFAGKLPHVIVHVNAGWAIGLALPALLKWAADYNIGIVEVGDDDISGLDSMFAWMSSAPRWEPMTTGVWLNQPDDTLSIRLQPGCDTIIDRSAYPHINGLVRNVVDSILHDSTLYFIPYTDTGGRCEADPDVYAVDSGSKLLVHAFAYQQAYNDSCDTLSFTPDQTCSNVVGMPGEWNVISVFQDTVLIGAERGLRRAVSLSFQPQFLQERIAAEQLVYDAVMYASTVHLGNPPTPEVDARRIAPESGVPSGALRAGDMRGARVRMVDIRGRIVFEGILDSRDPSPLGDRRSGVYVASVMSPGNGSTRKGSVKLLVAK